MRILISSFNQSLRSTPFVFKMINRYFGLYFIGFGLVILLIFNFYFPFNQGGLSFFSPATLIQPGLIFLSKIFTVFIIPYYAYKNSQGNVSPFWTFIAETVWPVVLSHIKAFFIILFFFLLLIIPGMYKAIRYTFLTEAVFFDISCKQGSFSVLKSADKTTRGYFWLIFIFIIFVYIFSSLFGLLIKYILPPSLLKEALSFIVYFYIGCFLILFKTQFYFELKKRRGESISC